MNPELPPALPGIDDERSSKNIGRRLSAAIIVVVVAGALGGWYRSSSATEPPPVPQAAVSDSLARPPAGERVRVRVLNITLTRGLAKRATAVLRQYGYDVVDYDTEAKAPGTPTRILMHTGREDVAQRLRRAVGTGAIDQRADSLRYVDFTVLVGSDWKPPAQPFRP